MNGGILNNIFSVFQINILILSLFTNLDTEKKYFVTSRATSVNQ